MKRLFPCCRISLLILLAVSLLCSCSKRGHEVIHNLKDLQGIHIGMVGGTTHEAYVRNDFPNAEAEVFDTYAWKEISEDNPDITEYTLYWRAEPFGMIFNKSDTVLLGQFNAFLADFSGIPRTGESLKVIQKGVVKSIMNDGDIDEISLAIIRGSCESMEERVTDEGVELSFNIAQ